ALSLLEKAYQNRCFVALVAFRNESAEVLLQPTRSVVHAFRRLRQLPAGGTTPLAAALRSGNELIRRSLDRDPVLEPFIVLITDGRATYPATNAFGDAPREASFIAERKWPALCIDTESGPMRLGQTQILANTLHGDYLHTDRLPESRRAPIIE